MGIEVIHYKDDFFSIRRHDIYKVSDFLCPVKGRAVLIDTGMMSASKWLGERKDAAGAGLHAISIRRASARPSSFRLALSEFTLLLMEVTKSTPPSA